jgi:hypothetical protein
VLASAALSAFVSLAETRARIGPRAIALLWSLAAAVPGLAVAHVLPRADLSRFHGTDVLDDFRHRQLPARSVLIASSPQLVFRQLELMATERVRRDVAILPLPFLRYPGVAQATVRKHPDLSAIVNDFLRSERLEPGALLQLARSRPVLVELDPHVPQEVYPLLLPIGALYAVAGPRAAVQSLPAAAALQQRIYRAVETDLGAGVHEVETAHQLLWSRYMDALFSAARGQRDLARAAAAAATALDPDDEQLRALRDALEHGGPGQLDVHKFLAFDADARAP